MSGSSVNHFFSDRAGGGEEKAELALSRTQHEQQAHRLSLSKLHSVSAPANVTDFRATSAFILTVVPREKRFKRLFLVIPESSFKRPVPGQGWERDVCQLLEVCKLVCRTSQRRRCRSGCHFLLGKVVISNFNSAKWSKPCV